MYRVKPNPLTQQQKEEVQRRTEEFKKRKQLELEAKRKQNQFYFELLQCRRQDSESEEDSDSDSESTVNKHEEVSLSSSTLAFFTPVLSPCPEKIHDISAILSAITPKEQDSEVHKNEISDSRSDDSHIEDVPVGVGKDDSLNVTSESDKLKAKPVGQLGLFKAASPMSQESPSSAPRVE